MALRVGLVAIVCLLVAVGLAGGVAADDVRPAAGSIAKKCSKHRGHFKTKAAKRWHKRHCKSSTTPGGGGGDSPGGSGGGGAPCPHTAASPGQLSAQEDDTPLPYRIKLSTTAIECGRIVVEHQNAGEDPHDLVLQKSGDAFPSYAFGVLGPGLNQRQDVDLSRGSWVLYCDLPGHREAGMQRTLTVN
jgi:hypothetical protein